MKYDLIRWTFSGRCQGAKVGLFFIYAIADASFFILLGMFFSFGPLTTRASLQETGLLP